jgi:hypothetical protein
MKRKNLLFGSRSKQLGLCLTIALLRNLYSIFITEVGPKKGSSTVQDVSNDPVKLFDDIQPWRQSRQYPTQPETWSFQH